MGKVKIERVVVDTNVLVSALLFGGTPADLIPLWKSGKIRAFASKEMIEEYLRVLAYPRFGLSENDIAYLVYKEILPYFEAVSVKKAISVVEKDPSDDKFIACAQASGSRFIISGDNHLLKLKNHGNIKILTPSNFLNRTP